MTRKEWETEVRIACYKRGKTLVDVAEAIGYSISHVRKIASGCAESKRVEDAMSNYLGIGTIERG